MINGSNLNKKLLKAGLDKESFSTITNTPMSTINEWMSKRNGEYRNCPNWVEAYLTLYIESKEDKVFIEKLITALKKDNQHNEKN